MTYSISWALFSLGLLLVGTNRRLPGARYIGAISIVAIIAIVASFLFQRFLGPQNQPPKSDNNRTP
jgi:hypothetical protein